MRKHMVYIDNFCSPSRRTMVMAIERHSLYSHYWATVKIWNFSAEMASSFPHRVRHGKMKLTIDCDCLESALLNDFVEEIKFLDKELQ